MKLLLENACHIEDRRAETSREKPSLLVQETCSHCGEDFIYIVSAKDASNVTDMCVVCSGQQALLRVFDDGELVEQCHVWSEDEAAEKLIGVQGTMAYLTKGYDAKQIWWFKDGSWQPRL